MIPGKAEQVGGAGREFIHRTERDRGEGGERGGRRGKNREREGEREPMGKRRKLGRKMIMRNKESKCVRKH